MSQWWDSKFTPPQLILQLKFKHLAQNPWNKFTPVALLFGSEHLEKCEGQKQNLAIRGISDKQLGQGRVCASEGALLLVEFKMAGKKTLQRLLHDHDFGEFAAGLQTCSQFCELPFIFEETPLCAQVATDIFRCGKFES